MRRFGGDQGATDEIGLQVEVDQLQLLYRQTRPAAPVSVAVGVVYAWLMWPRADEPVLLLWFALLLATALARALLFLAWSHWQPSGRAALRWRAPFLLTALASALIWGLGTVAVVPVGDVVAEALTVAVLVGFAGGAVSTYTASYRLTVAAVAILLLPQIAVMLHRGGDTEMALAALLAIFLLGVRAVRVLSEALTRAFRLHHELEVAHALAERIANTDPLTGIPNRRAFLDGADALATLCRRHGQPVSVLLIDVDHFKGINDRLGHAAGDAVLREIAIRIAAACRRSDLVGRIGGEEFAVLLPNTPIDEARHLAERIRAAVGDSPLAWEGHHVALTLSLGVAEGSEALDALMRRADTALYRAKSEGRDRVAVA